MKRLKEMDIDFRGGVAYRPSSVKSCFDTVSDFDSAEQKYSGDSENKRKKSFIKQQKKAFHRKKNFF